MNNKLTLKFLATLTLLLGVSMGAQAQLNLGKLKEKAREAGKKNVENVVAESKESMARCAITGWMIAAVILAGAYAPSIYHSWSSPEQGIKMVIALFFLIVVLCILGYLYYKRLMLLSQSRIFFFSSSPLKS